MEKRYFEKIAVWLLSLGNIKCDNILIELTF